MLSTITLACGMKIMRGEEIRLAKSHAKK